MKNTKNSLCVCEEELPELYEAAVFARAEEIEKGEKYMRQYLGSDEIDGSAERALTTRNITFEIIESEINSSVPYPKVEPLAYSESHSAAAKSAERLCRTLRDSLHFDRLNDSDERYTYIYGASIFYIEWDSRSSPSGIKVHCLPPSCFFAQPGVNDIQSMDYCFLRFSTTKGELLRRYGLSPEKLSLTDTIEEKDGGLYDTVSLVTAFYRDGDGDVCRAIFSGRLMLENIKKFYKRKGLVCKKCGEPRGACKCSGGYITGDLEYEYINLGGRRQKLPYYLPRRFPIVIRRSSFSESSPFGISDCERIRPHQQAINKIESRILEKLLRSAVTPVIPEDADFSVTNSVFGRVIKLRPGESRDAYGVIDTTPDIAADINEADRLYDQAKRIIGITDALQGSDSLKAESGYARQLRISQSTGRLESKVRLKERAYADIYSLIFKHYLAFADEIRPLSYKDSEEKLHVAEFSRADFIEKCPDGSLKVCDDFIFTADKSGESAYGRESLWERNLSNLESGSLGDKTSPETLLIYWQLQERAGYPFASIGAEHFKGLTNENKNKEKEKKQ